MGDLGSLGLPLVHCQRWGWQTQQLPSVNIPWLVFPTTECIYDPALVRFGLAGSAWQGKEHGYHHSAWWWGGLVMLRQTSPWAL